MQDVQDNLGVILFSGAHRDQVYPLYAKLRAQGPMAAATFPNGQPFWVATTFEAANDVLKSHERFGNNVANAMSEEELAAFRQAEFEKLPAEMQEQALEVDRILGQNLLAQDPPEHSRLRRLVAIPFTPKFIEQMRGRVQAIADQLVDDIEQRIDESGSREFELIDNFAYPLPLIVIAELLGIPEDDRSKFRVWSAAAVSFQPSEEADPEETKLFAEFVAYLRELVAEKRANPGDDLLSGLVQAEAEGDRLSEDELLSMMFLLIVAGHETTVNLIANGMLALFEHPEQYALLRQNSDPELLKNAIEEMLRYYGPVELSLSRWVREDTEVGGIPLPRGGHVMALLASANRDETRFSDADRFDVTREPERHLAFGTGIHACLGAVLARLEGQVAFATLFSRLPGLALGIDRDEVEWRDGTFLRSLTRLPVTV